MQQIAENLFLFQDTCSVYVLRAGRDAVLIDFGGGDVLDHLAEIGVDRVTHILMTHHHRDQAQGLGRAVGSEIWVPHTEQDLFRSVDAHWQSRELYNNYNMRQDRFSLLASVLVDGTLEDYQTYQFGAQHITVVPTPGHTIGSISLMTTVDGVTVAFTGDLIAAPGKVWSMAATQWSYNGAEGAAASIASLLDLKARQPALLLPAHGVPMEQPAQAIDLLVERLWQLLKLRGQHSRLFEVSERPYANITPHLLMHRASVANSYVLLSERGTALMIDFGYDFIIGLGLGSDRASRRPWLYSIPALKRQHQISKIDVVIPTHFHDDHVAGMNLLHRVEGTQIWAAEMFAPILENPSNYDLPCLWYDPIPVDRQLPLETSFQWEEYTLTLHALPGHTRYAVAISFEVDGYRVLATGDQYQGDNGLEFNYVYYNRFEADDYVKSAELYKRLRPDVILSGHWQPLWTTANYFEKLLRMGRELEALHHDLLPSETDEEGFIARISPYQTTIVRGEPFRVRVDLNNPLHQPAEAVIKLVLPPGWGFGEAEFMHISMQPDKQGKVTVCLDAEPVQSITFQICPPPNVTVRRARIGVDVNLNGQAFGQQAEALVTTF